VKVTGSWSSSGCSMNELEKMIVFLGFFNSCGLLLCGCGPLVILLLFYGLWKNFLLPLRLYFHPYKWKIISNFTLLSYDFTLQQNPVSKKYQHPKLQIGKSDKIFSEQLLYLFWYKKVFNLSAEHSLKSFWFVITYCSSKLHNFWMFGKIRVNPFPFVGFIHLYFQITTQ
jgi:hypothetical protein